MQAQLDRILERAGQDKAAVQVMPFTVGAHPSTDSNFVLLEFGHGSPQPPVVFADVSAFACVV